MSSIQEILASILNAVYGKDVRQAIHDGVEMAYNKADDAATSAAAAAEAASGSQESAAASAQAASNSASSASDFADAAEQYKNEAFHTTPAGYEDFVNQVNSSLDDLFNTNVKNILPNKLRPETNSGITVTLNDDGSVTLNGTATADHNFPVLDRITSGFKLPQGNYRLSGCPSGGSTSTYWVTLNYSKSGTTGGTNFADDVGNGADFTVSSTLENDPNFSIGYLIRVKSGTVCNNLTFKPMVTKKNVPNSDYAHYVPFVQTNLVLTKYQNGLLIQKIIEASTIDEFLEDAMTDLVSGMENLQFKVAEYLWSGHLVFVFQIFKYDSTNAFGTSFRYDKLYLITLINGTLTYKEFATVS